jgi:hypothetical protein
MYCPTLKRNCIKKTCRGRVTSCSGTQKKYSEIVWHPQKSTRRYGAHESGTEGPRNHNLHGDGLKRKGYSEAKMTWKEDKDLLFLEIN